MGRDRQDAAPGEKKTRERGRMLSIQSRGEGGGRGEEDVKQRKHLPPRLDHACGAGEGGGNAGGPFAFTHRNNTSRGRPGM